MKIPALTVDCRIAKSAVSFVAACALTACATPQTPNSTLPVADETERALLERARAIHQKSLILDAHADIVLPSTPRSYLGTDGKSKVSPAKLKAGNMGAVVMSVAVGPGPRTPAGDALARAEADKKLVAAKEMANQNVGLELATSPDQITAAHNEGKIAFVLGFQNARSLEGDVSNLDHFYKSGVRVFGLNHLGHNEFSDSSRPSFDGETGKYEVSEEHGGLSPLGAAAIKRINKLGGIVDISQMSKAATLQAIGLSKAPVIASHSNVRKLSDVSRNLSDEEIDQIAETGGVIHVAAFAAYLVDLSDPAMLASIKKVRLDAGLPETYSYPYELYWEIPDLRKRRSFLLAMRAVIGAGSVDRLIDHIDYIVGRVGIDHVGIGSDFNHGGGIEGFVDASEALNVTVGLVRRGYSAGHIEKIWSKNFLRVFEKAQHTARKSSLATKFP